MDSPEEGRITCLSSIERPSLSTQFPLRFEDIERALRDQQEELLIAEGQAGKLGGQRRAYWVEDGDHWGLLSENAVDDEALTTDDVLWTQAPPFASTQAADVHFEEEPIYDGTYEWTFWHDEWHAQLEDGSFVAYSDLKPWLDIEDIAYEDAALGKELHDMYMAMDQKIRTFREAKHALYQKGKSRGYFKPKGFGKGKGKKGGKGSVMMVSPNVKGNSKGSGKAMSSGSGGPSKQPGFTGCFICGDLQHDYRNCPKRVSSQGSGSKGGRSIGFVDAVSSDDGHLDASAISAAFMVEEEEQTLMTQDRDHGVENLEHSIMVAKEAFPKHFSLNERLKYAVVDTGATETVGSLDALDVIMKCRSTLFRHEPITIDPHAHKQFRFGNGQTRQSESLVYVPQQVNGRPTGLGVFALDVPEIPVLLGIKTLRRLGAILNTRYDTVEFSSLFPGVIIPLTRGRNGHMLLNLVEDWVPPQYDVVPGQVTVFGTEVPGRENESNTLPLPTLHVDQKGSERETEEQVTHEGRKNLSLGTEVHDSQNVHAQEPADAVAREVSFRTNVSPESESHAGSIQHGHDQGGSQEPGQGSSQEGVLGGSLGLGSSGRTGSERSQGLRPSLHGKPCAGSNGPREQKRLQRPWALDGVWEVLPTPLLHTSGGSKGDLPTVSSSRSRHDRGGEGEGQRCDTGRPHHEGHRSGCSGALLAQQAQESSGREEGDPASQGVEGCQGGDNSGRGNSEDRGSDHAGISISQEAREREDSRDAGSGRRMGLYPTDGLRDERDDDFSKSSFERTLTDADVQMLEQSLRSSCEEIQEALATLPGSQMDLIEVCCGPDSTLVATLLEKGGNGGRVGLHNNMNITTAHGLDRAKVFCDTVRPKYLWLSPICGPTSPIQNLNERTEEQKRKRENKRKVSRKMAKGCIALAKDQVARGGHIAWEWPRDNHAWKFKEVQHFFYWLETQGLLFEARLDGCMVGVKALDCDIAMKKPWKIKTTDATLAQVLNIPCSRDHEHVECMGHNRAESSAYYPQKMCRLIARHVMSSTNVCLCDAFAVHEHETKTLKDTPEEYPEMSQKELKDLKDTIHRLHMRSGHPTNQALVNCLKARGVPKHVIELAKEHRCDSCQEVRLPQPHNKSSLRETETLWHTIQMDIGQFKVGEMVVHFLLIIDEASHFAVAHELFRTSSQESRNSTTEEIVKGLESSWVQYFGFPNVLRCDAEGSFKGHNLGLWCQERGIELAHAPGEDHAQLGGVERLIGKLKTDSRTYLRDVAVDPFSGILHMVNAHNTLDRIGGYAPCQWAHGRFPTFDGRLFEGGNHLPVHASEGTKNSNMQQQLQLRVKAEEYYRKSMAADRITRAMNSKSVPQQIFVPGDLVYYRRYKTPAQLPSHKELDGPKVGLARWYGPARVLATETRSELESGVRRPGQVVWVIAAGRLKRCSPQQLRFCSERERLIVEASGGNVAMPWSFSSMLGQIERGQYDTFDDLAFEESHPNQKPEASSMQPKTPRTRARSRSVHRTPVKREDPEDDHKHPKRPLSEEAQSRPQQDPRGQTIANEGAAPSTPGQGAPSSSSSKTPKLDAERFIRDKTYDPLKELPSPRPIRVAPVKRSVRARSHGELERNPLYKKQRDKFYDGEKTLYELLQGETMAVEDVDCDQFFVCAYSVDVPTDPRGLKQFRADPSRYVTKKMKANAEVKLSTLSKEEVEKFKVAKQTEVQNWIREAACRGVQHAVPSHRVMRMRWVLTFKDDGRAKARIVILGFEDPDLLKLERAAPTMTRQSRQLFLTYAALKRWTTLKGDIKGAFLQGTNSEELREVYAWPVEELAEALNIPKDQPVQLLKACYGLVNAPAEWFKSVCSAMQEAGFESLVSEPCMWRIRGWSEEEQKMVVVGLVTAHVDDFLFTGDELSPTWRKAVSQIYHRFLWSPWEVDSFAHCGVKITQNTDFTFNLDHSEFCTGLQQITVGTSRSDEEAATPEEVAQLRGILGSVQWRAYQTAPQHSARLGLLQSEMANATVRTLRSANKLCREVFQHRHLSVKINMLDVESVEDVCFVAWSDAAVGNRPAGGSTGGYVVTATSPKLLQGKATALNLISWKSGRLRRIARSSLSAEVQAFSEAEEELMFARLQWAEMCGFEVPLKTPEKCVSQISGTLVTDARSLFDVVMKGDQNTSGFGLRERYSALELMSVMQRLKMCSTSTRWVHSEAQLADALTKPLVTASLHQVLVKHTWTLVEDPNFVSSKNRKKLERIQ